MQIDAMGENLRALFEEGLCDILSKDNWPCASKTITRTPDTFSPPRVPSVAILGDTEVSARLV